MKTNQEMVRYIDNFSVIQRTSDGYFDGGELLRQWNNVDENPRRRMSEFIDSPKTKEFLKALYVDESHRLKTDIGENQLLIKTKGRNTKDGNSRLMLYRNGNSAPIQTVKILQSYYKVATRDIKIMSRLSQG